MLRTLVLLSLLFPFANPVGASEGSASDVRGEALAPAACGPSVVESFDVVLARERASIASGTIQATPLAAPRTAGGPTAEEQGGTTALGGGGTTPALGTNFQGPWINDPGAGWIPPDPHGAIGPNHFVAIVNQHLSVYTRAGVRVLSTSLQSFFGVGGSLGDPRACYDHSSGRFVISVSDFSSRIRLAVSASDDPTGSWFKTSFVAASGSDLGAWPDYPTLGFDANGIYFAAFMVGTPGNTMTIFALDKAPLVGSPQALGAVTAFRDLPYEDAIQPCVTFGSPPGEYLISRASGTTLRLRRVNPPLAAPTLSELGLVSVPSNTSPPNAPAQGATVALATIDARPQGAVYQAGSLWVPHTISVSGRAGVRWYQIDPLTVTTQQVGTIDDPVRHYFFPSLAVNPSGDVAIAFAGSHSGEFAGAWYSGRKAGDAAGQTGAPALLKAGAAPYQLTDGQGRNRWGDYTNTTLDPQDPQSFWTIQEYAQATNAWGTWIGKLGFAGPAAITPFCAGDGVDPAVTTPCPCANFGALGHGCANTVDPSGALLSATGSTNPDTIAITASGLPATALTIFLRGDALVAGGTVFGDGLRCVGGNLVRFGNQNAVGGQSIYPRPGDPSVSTLFGIVPGSNVHVWVQAYFRDPFAGFCPPDTFNVTNALDLLY